MDFDEYGAMIAREYFVYKVEPVPVIHGIRITTYAEIKGNKVFVDTRTFSLDELLIMEKNNDREQSSMQ